MQDHYLKVIDEVFKDQIHAWVPRWNGTSPVLEMIEKLSNTMFGKEGLLMAR
jgi:hypothetical protein